MTSYQIDLVVNTYFETLMQKGISEKLVDDMYQKEGVLNIILKDGTIVREKIKNFNNGK